jgi:hypothetical protein
MQVWITIGTTFEKTKGFGTKLNCFALKKWYSRYTIEIQYTHKYGFKIIETIKYHFHLIYVVIIIIM